MKHERFTTNHRASMHQESICFPVLEVGMNYPSWGPSQIALEEVHRIANACERVKGVLGRGLTAGNEELFDVARGFARENS